MGCACGTKKGEKVGGCDNNGACGTGGCNKMNVFDWLSNMDMPVEDKFDVVEVRFKGGRKDFYRNTEKLNLTTGDAIILEVQNGHIFCQRCSACIARGDKKFVAMVALFDLPGEGMLAPAIANN